MSTFDKTAASVRALGQGLFPIAGTAGAALALMALAF